MDRYFLPGTDPEYLIGGEADDISFIEFDPKELAMGIDVELEHTDNIMIAMEIAMDHLAEDPKYYTKLKRWHNE